MYVLDFGPTQILKNLMPTLATPTKNTEKTPDESLINN